MSVRPSERAQKHRASALPLSVILQAGEDIAEKRKQSQKVSFDDGAATLKVKTDREGCIRVPFGTMHVWVDKPTGGKWNPWLEVGWGMYVKNVYYECINKQEDPTMNIELASRIQTRKSKDGAEMTTLKQYTSDALRRMGFTPPIDEHYVIEPVSYSGEQTVTSHLCIVPKELAGSCEERVLRAITYLDTYVIDRLQDYHGESPDPLAGPEYDWRNEAEIAPPAGENPDPTKLHEAAQFYYSRFLKYLRRSTDNKLWDEFPATF